MNRSKVAVDDASRVIAGLGAVFAAGLRDSKLIRQSAAFDHEAAIKYAATFVQTLQGVQSNLTGKGAPAPLQEDPYSQTASSAERASRASSTGPSAPTNAVPGQQYSAAHTSDRPDISEAATDAFNQISLAAGRLAEQVSPQKIVRSAAAAGAPTAAASQVGAAGPISTNMTTRVEGGCMTLVAARQQQQPLGQLGRAVTAAAQQVAGSPSVPSYQSPATSLEQDEAPRRTFRARRVPESPFGRAMGFAGMGASLVMGNFMDGVAKSWNGSGVDTGGAAAGTSGKDPSKVYSSYISEGNAERLATALCRMRGAALKIGQMLSIQDENVLPPQVQAALERVRAGADMMPRSQLEQVLRTELGEDWRSKVKDFDMEPFAAASIGQVHAATLHDGRRVAIKIQYPGVARSIESDVDNIMRLISMANFLPKGMFIESAIRVAKQELKLECDYRHEAAAQRRFAELVKSEPRLQGMRFNVPATIPELCTARVLTTEWVSGVHIDKVRDLPQEVRDSVGTRVLNLTLHELYVWRFMQTDPNWGNFLYDARTDTLHLIDFGAAREYPEDFVRGYQEMVSACAERDGNKVVEYSTKLGFLTGDESRVMLDAHTEAGFVAGQPFNFDGIYDFGAQESLTARITELGAIMLKNRLTPPPPEAYSLHRKLSGAFLACLKLGARVPCRQLFYDMYNTPNILKQ